MNEEWFKKIMSFFYLLLTLPKYFQIFFSIWIIMGFIIFILITFHLYNEKHKIIKVLPFQEGTDIPYLGSNQTTLILGLIIWAKENESIDVSFINMDIINKDNKIDGNFIIDILDKNNKNIEFPITLNDKDKNIFLIKINSINKEAEEIKAKINIIPYNAKQKQSIDLKIHRSKESFQVALMYGGNQLEFGKVKTHTRETKLKLLNEYNKKPEVSIKMKE